MLGILEELCGVLDDLHRRQPPVVHRDLKPGNVNRRPDGRLAVVDFGSVRDAMRCADLGGSTVAGTFGYMAPEQFAGDAEPRSDLYALGALGIHLLTRQPPHALQRPGQPLAFQAHAALRPEVAALLRDLVALEPEERPRDARSVAAWIRSLRTGEPPEEPDGDPGAPATGAAPAEETPAQRSPPRATELPGAPHPVATVGPDPAWLAPRRPPSPFTDELRLTVFASRAVQAADEGAIVDAIHETIGLDGEGHPVDGGYRWRSKVQGRAVRLAIDTLDGAARIRIVEDHTPATLGLWFGLVGAAAPPRLSTQGRQSVADEAGRREAAGVDLAGVPPPRRLPWTTRPASST